METPTPRCAMIFAAGLGTRLKPITDTMPKALVPVCGKPLIQHVVDKLVAAGYNRIVINVHHFADQIVRWVDAHPIPGVSLMIADEREGLLETGGGLLHAAPLLLESASAQGRKVLGAEGLSTPGRGQGEGPAGYKFFWRTTGDELAWRTGGREKDAGDGGRGRSERSERSSSAPSTFRPGAEPILVHNVDILSDIDLEALRGQWREDALALVAVSPRKTQRYFLFDDDGRLAGWTHLGTGEVRSPYGGIDPGRYRPLAFSGIHLVSPGIFQAMAEEGFSGRFSITDFYLKVCARHPVYAAETPGATILDVGKIDTLPEVEAAAEKILR